MKKLVSALLLGAGVASGVSGFAAVPAGYETDGLVACWDAIDNQGTGTQVRDATTWVDLVGGVTFDLAGATWKDFSLSLSGSSSGGVATGATFLNYTAENMNRTVEIVYRYASAPSGYSILLMGSSSAGVAIGWLSASSTIASSQSSNTLPGLPVGTVSTLSYGYEGQTAKTGSTFHDGEAVAKLSNKNNWSGSDSNVYLGKRSTGNPFKGEMFAVRVYNRLLTPEEVAANRAADVARFGYALAATVSTGSVTVSEPAVAIGGNVYVPEGVTELPIASATDATILTKGFVTSISLVSGTLALDSTCAGRLKLDSLELGAEAVLQLPPMGVRVGTTLTAETGAVVKGPGKLYGPEESCPAELQDGATYASLTAAGPYGYVDGGELIAQWDAIDNKATGTHGTGKSWVDLIGGKQFAWTAGPSWQDKSLRFSGSSSIDLGLSDTFMNFVSGDTARTVEIAFKSSADSDGVMVLFLGSSSSRIAITRYNAGVRATIGTAKLYPAIADGAFSGISYGYVSGVPQEDCTYHDGEPVAQGDESPAEMKYSGNPVRVGFRSGFTDGYHFKGDIYAVRVYDRLLTADEVAANHLLDVDRFAMRTVATVVSGSVTVGGRTFSAGEAVRYRIESTELPVDSADDAEILLDTSVTSLSVASGSLAVDLVQTGRRLRLDALDLGEDVVLRLPPQGVRVGTTLTAADGAVVKGPGKIYGPEASCPAELRDGAVYVSLTAPDKYGYVDGGELIAQWDAIDNQATGTHDASATTWVDLIMGQAFRPTGTEWGEKYLRFAGTSKSYATLTGDDALALLDYTDESTTRTVELVFKYDDTASDGVLIEGPTHSGIAIGRYHGGARTIYQIANGKTEATEPDDGFYTISACYDKGVVQIGPTRQDNEAVSLTKGNNYWGSANATTITLGKTTTGTSYYFAGRLYAIRVYDRQLTEAEATQNYNADQLRFNRAPAATVVSGSVTAGGVTYEAGETILTPDDELTLAVESAADAILVLDARITGLSLADGALKLDDSPAGAVENLGSLALGATAVLQLPKDGLRVAGELTAEAGATVKGPGLLVGAAATCPAGLTLTDGAVYLSSQGGWAGWPSSGIAYIPADVTAPILAGDVEKVANLEKIVFLADTAKVTYEQGDAFELTTPVEGPGTFAFASAGDVTISADNANLTGAFFFTNTTVLVTHENGLGSTQAQTCHFWPGNAGTYGRQLDFDNGEAVFTNRVAIHLHPLAGKHVSFGSVASGKTLVQDADMTYERAGSAQEALTFYFKNDVWLTKAFRFKASQGYIYPRWQCLSGSVGHVMGTVNTGSTGILYLEGGEIHWGSSWAPLSVGGGISYPSLQPYTASKIVCEAADVFGNCPVRVQQVESTIDLNGFDQSFRSDFCVYSSSGRASGTPIVKVTSATPAAFRIASDKSFTINPSFSGAAGFTMAGSGTYGLSNGTGESVIDTTGELKVEKGRLNVSGGYVWSGTNVTVTGGLLVLDTLGAVAKDKTHLRVSSGQLALTANCGKSILVGSATFGATDLEEGTYAKADLLAMPDVAPFVGDAWDDGATLTVQRPSDFDWTGWPDEPSDVKVPGNTTVYVGADETNKVALALSIDLGVNAKVVFTNMPDAVITFAVPLSGKGVFAFEDCGTVVITADNSNLLAPGAFSFKRTNVIVANRYGLGCAETGAATHECALRNGAPGRRFAFTGDATTNDVAVVLDNAVFFGHDDPAVEFVQNGAFSQSGGSTSDDWQRMGLNSVTFRGETKIHVTKNNASRSSVIRFADTAKLTAVSQQFCAFGAPAATFYFDSPTPSYRMREFYPQNDVVVHLDVPFAFDLGDGVTAWNRGVYFMHGNDQQVACFNFAGGTSSYLTGGEPVIFTSETPATLYMTNNLVNHNTGVGLDSQRTFCVTGAVSLVYAGKRTQKMGCGLNETSGSLTVCDGTLEMANLSYWGGTNVTVSGGTLVIGATCRKKANGAGDFFARKADLAIATAGATLEIAEGRTDTVRTLKVGDGYVKAGVYGGPESSAAQKLDCLAGKGLLRVRRNSPDEGIVILVR